MTHNLLISNKKYLILVSDSLGVDLDTKKSHIQRKSYYSANKSFALALYGGIVLVNDKSNEQVLLLEKVVSIFSKFGESAVNSLVEKALGNNLQSIKQNWNVGVFGIFLGHDRKPKFFIYSISLTKSIFTRKIRSKKKSEIHYISKRASAGTYSTLLKKWPNGDVIGRKDEKFIDHAFNNLIKKIDNISDKNIIIKYIQAYYQHLKLNINASFFMFPIQIHFLNETGIETLSIS